MKTIFLALGFLFLVSSCTQKPGTSSNLLHLIPQKSAAVLRIPDWDAFGQSLKSSELSNLLESTELAKTLNNYSNLFSNFKPDSETYISFVALGENDYDIALITEFSENSIAKDSSFQNSLTKIDYEGSVINTYKIGETEVFYIISNSFLIASTSKLILENTILQDNSGRDPIDDALQKMIKTSDAKHVNLYVRGSYYKRIFKDILPQFRFPSREIPFDWAALDLEIETSSTEVNGVITSSDQDHQTLGLLNKLESSNSNIAEITPSSSRGFSSLNISNCEVYKGNLAQKRDALLKDFALPLEDFFNSIEEIGIIYGTDQNIIVTRSSDIPESEKSLAPFSTEKSEYRTIPIYKLSDSLAFQKAFVELLNPPSVHVYCKIDSYFAFAKTTSELEDLIANYQNGSTLSKNLYYKELQKKLSDESTLFFYTNTSNQKNYLKQFVSKKEGQILSEINFEEYPNAGLQFIQADGFTYVNAAMYKFSEEVKQSQISQIASVKLDQDLLNNPQLLNNYRTKGKNILVQDISNKLYHIDGTGKIEWKKELDGPILGKIQQIDLYKNGRLQYAFNTPSTFYVIASDGTIVKPFGFKTENSNTQPLAVFDYDGNRNYRFVVTQGQNLKMYDSNAKIVSGFDFVKAPSNLVQKPQHIRMGSKDYILVSLENGKLLILDRRGSVRIELNDTFNFSERPFSSKDGNFVFYEKEGSRITISQSGKISKTKNSLGKDFLYDKLDTIEATLSENILKINGSKIELDLGIYSGLKIIRFQKKYYILLTDLQTNKVYLFDVKSNLLPNFPVYGSSKADAGDLNSINKLGFITKGESNSVLIYQIN